MKTRYKDALYFFISYFIVAIAIDLFSATGPLSQTTLLKIIIEELIQALFIAIIPLTVISLMFDMPGTKLAKLDLKEHLNQGEQILLETVAIHSKYNDNSEGKLALTNNRILFLGNRWKEIHHPLSISLDTIVRVKERRFLWIFFSYGLTFMTTDGKKEKFVIDDLKPWIDILKQQHIGSAA